MTRVFFLIVVALGCAGPLVGRDETATLIACPDCRREVSRRAVMCPGCGCPGAAIVEAVRAEAEKNKPKPPTEVVTGMSDRGRFTLTPVRMQNGFWLVGARADAAGVQTLVIRNDAHREEVNYTRIQRHARLPLIAFETTSNSNIVFRPLPTMVGNVSLTDDAAAWTRVSPRELRKLSQEESK